MEQGATVMASLTDCIFEALPAGDYCLPALLRVVEVVETDRVPTASIECSDWPRLLVNPEFVNRHANTPEKLLMLVLHELHHVILGHTRKVRRPGPLENLAFDMVINAMLSRSVRDPRARALFTDVYAPDRLPEALLRPPYGFRLSHARDRELASATLPWHSQAQPTLRENYHRLYFGQGTTYSEVLEALRQHADTVWGGELILLGSHGNDDVDLRPVAQRSPVLHGALKEAVARWPKGEQAAADMSLTRALLDPAKVPPSLREQFRRAIASVAAPGIEFTSSVSAPTLVEIESVIPRTSRRGIVGQAMGVPPVLHPDAVLGLPRPRAGTPVHVYLDVSGSVSAFVAHLLGAILDAGNAVHPVVHQFSTVIVDVDRKDLRHGQVESTGGTDISCVTSHLVANRVRRALIVTDGYVGWPDANGAAALESAAVAVALTPDGSRQGLERHIQSRRWFDLKLPVAS
jgi:hypothetical protein